MTILGCVPADVASPLSGLWRGLAERCHIVHWWGEGRAGYDRTMSIAAAHPEPVDLVLCADAQRKRSAWWNLAGVDAKHTAAVLVDGCYYTERFADWANEQGIDLVLVRGRDDVPKARRLMPDRIVEWLPFGVDDGVFYDYEEPKRWDVGLFGHRGGHTYPVRMLAQEALAAAARDGTITFLDATVPGDKPPTVVGEDYARLLCQCRVVVVTCGAYRYPFMKYFEAMACNVAVVGNVPAHGAEQLYTPGQHYVAFDDDCSNLVAQIVYLLDNPADMATLAMRACTHVHENHTNAHRAARLEELLEWQ